MASTVNNTIRDLTTNCADRPHRLQQIICFIAARVRQIATNIVNDSDLSELKTASAFLGTALIIFAMFWTIQACS